MSRTRNWLHDGLGNLGPNQVQKHERVCARGSGRGRRRGGSSWSLGAELQGSWASSCRCHGSAPFCLAGPCWPPHGGGSGDGQGRRLAPWRAVCVGGLGCQAERRRETWAGPLSGHQQRWPGAARPPARARGQRRPQGVSVKERELDGGPQQRALRAELGVQQRPGGSELPRLDTRVGSLCFLGGAQGRGRPPASGVGGNRCPPCFPFWCHHKLPGAAPTLPRLLFCSRGVSVMIRHYLKHW